MNLRVVWNRAVLDRPWIAAVHPDAAVPEWQMGRLAAVTFWRIIADDGRTTVRHLERHEPGRILHGVYQGTAETLGHPVPLTEYPETQHLAAGLVDGNAVPTGASRLTAVYIRNVRPNRLWRNLPEAAYLGRSDYAGVDPLMDALDETWSSWMRDLRLGKAMLVVPNEYLISNGPGQDAYYTAEREIWQGINAMGDESGKPTIEHVQFNIRVQEHQQTAAELVQAIARSAGYSPQSFGLSGDVAATATEVTARERRSFTSRDRKIRYWRPALRDILGALLEVDRAVFGTPVVADRPGVEFADGVSPDPEAQARTIPLPAAAEAISVDTKVRMVHPDWDDAQVTAEVQRIRDDSGATVQDPETFTGAPPPDTEDEDQGDETDEDTSD